ncbi:iron complex transport system permease protein [Rhizobium sp. RU35A]|uniref:FecCD family ABC transporter permease n=1 Tax=Rhizobium sp. RU35A TaxID=1907414 RepID=UPI0009547472|nr:iron ABC transporter permease [Rhizobium sp. RU35A]SIP92362.1 iron complex transport system permease protein [Rhizobium sp. RU35A]
MTPLNIAQPAEDLGFRQDAATWRRVAIIAALFGAACIFGVLDIMIGSGTLSLSQVLAALFGPAHADPGAVFIVWSLRMPMTLMAAVTGIGLSLAGLLMQTILDNPLAEPFTLGVSSAAGFGAALTLAAGFAVSTLLPGVPPELVISINAFVFALLAVLLVLGLSQGARNVQIITLLGIALHFVFSALLSLVQYTASIDQLQSIVFWLMGSLQRATWLKLTITGSVVLAVLPVVLFHAWQLTALRSFGEQAIVFGVRVRRLRALMLVLSALLAGSVTAVVGIIGFIGLVAPHVARMLTGEDYRFTIASTMAVGALFVTIASLLSKVILPGAVLPLGMVTSLAGLPFFIFLILRKSRGSLR